MLSFKRYKELKIRQIELNHACVRSKSNIKYVQFKIKNGDNVSKYPDYHQYYNNYKKELNLINDTLRLHKILYKQHLTNQEFFRNI